MTNEDIKTVRLIINSEQAGKKLDELNAKLEQTRKKREEALEKHDTKGLELYTKEVRRLEREQQRLQTRAQTVTEVLRNMDKATPKQLKQTIRELNRELNSGAVERGSKQWEVMVRSLREAQNELVKINKEVKASGKTSDWLVNLGNRWVGVSSTIFTVWQTTLGLMNKADAFVQDYADMEEHMSQVRKYTGMSADAVQELNEEFKKMDTRTARQQLNDLAGDAGRLGITGRQDVLDFVDAANQINVALGEDLGEDAVKNIGKLAQLFGDADRMGLKQAMLSTGSVINDLAQTSSASEGYLMDFTARLAGVGHQAGMTQAEVMALGSVLDQGMVNVEKGATALQNVIMGLYQKPQELARIAGMDVKQFTALLKKDGNAALLQFIEALQKAGRMDVLAPMLEQMKLSGAGVTQTLTTLAANIGLVRQTQQQATAAFRDGTSVTEEYNVANNTVQAKLEKNSKKLHEMSVALGEELLPVYAEAKSLLSLITEETLLFIRAGKENWKILLQLSVAAIAFGLAVKSATAWKIAYTAATKVSTLALKAWSVACTTARMVAVSFRAVVGLLHVAFILMTKGTQAATVALRALKISLLTNPYTAAAAAILAIGAAVYKLTTWTREATKATNENRRAGEALRAANEKAGKQTAEEIASIRRLHEMLRNNAYSYDTKRKALAKLQSIVPGYQASLSKEGKLLKENAGAIETYIKQLQNKALAEAYYEKIVEIEKQLVDARSRKAAKSYNVEAVNAELERNPEKYKSKTRSMTYGTGFGSSVTLKDLETNQARIDKLEELNLQQNALNAATAEETKLLKEKQKIEAAMGKDNNIRSYFDSLVVKPVTDTDDDKKPLTPDEKENERKKRIRLEIQQLEKAQRQEESRLATLYVTGKTGYLEYKEQLYQLDKKALADKKALYKQGDTEIAEIEKQQEELEKKRYTDRKVWSLRQLETEYAARKEAQTKAYYQEGQDAQQHRETMDRIEMEYLQDRLAYLRDPLNGATPEEVYKAEQALEDTNRKQQAEREKRYLEKVRELRTAYAAKTPREVMDIEIQMLEKLHTEGLLKEEEYQKLLKQVRVKYQGLDGQGGEIGKDRMERAEQALKEARQRDEEPERTGLDASADLGFTGLLAAGSKISQASETYARLKEMREQDLISEQEYQDACKMLDNERFANFTAVAQAAYSAVGAIMSSASQFYQATQQAEEAKVTRRYDKEIEAAGANTSRGKALEEKKQKELARIKAKYNKKSMAIEIAQAMASTSMNALMAYGAVLMPHQPWTVPLAVAAAAAATAAGMLQVAAIKKQHEAQASGYYEGGFTGGNSYRKTAGIVHEGEFVANHLAVRNPDLMPVLSLIDHAQRNNTVAALTAADVSRAIGMQLPAGAGGPMPAADMTVQVVDPSSKETAETLRRLNRTIEEGLQATVVIDGPDGLDRQWKKYQQLKARKQ